MYNMKYLGKKNKICGNFAQAGRLLIYACGRIRQNFMSGLATTLLYMTPVTVLFMSPTLQKFVLPPLTLRKSAFYMEFS